MQPLSEKAKKLIFAVQPCSLPYSQCFLATATVRDHRDACLAPEAPSAWAGVDLNTSRPMWTYLENHH